MQTMRINIHISFSTLNLDRCLDFKTANAENHASHKYDVSNSINIRKLLLVTSSHSYFVIPKS